MISKLDRKIISLASRDIPLVKSPFRKLAQQVLISEENLLKKLKSYEKSGIMRKFAAVMHHRNIGFKYNAMVVWNVEQKQIKNTGDMMAEFDQVSHCYQRRRFSGWEYNLYSMVHAKTKKECFAVISKIAKKVNCDDYKVLFSSKEYKKAAVKY